MFSTWLAANVHLIDDMTLVGVAPHCFRSKDISMYGLCQVPYSFAQLVQAYAIVREKSRYLTFIVVVVWIFFENVGYDNQNSEKPQRNAFRISIQVLVHLLNEFAKTPIEMKFLTIIKTNSIFTSFKFILPRKNALWINHTNLLLQNYPFFMKMLSFQHEFLFTFRSKW